VITLIVGQIRKPLFHIIRLSQQQHVIALRGNHEVMILSTEDPSSTFGVLMAAMKRCVRMGRDIATIGNS
jgi:hypothetical protein